MKAQLWADCLGPNPAHFLQERFLVSETGMVDTASLKGWTKGQCGWMPWAWHIVPAQYGKYFYGYCCAVPGAGLEH